jgi:hypothetical protein
VPALLTDIQAAEVRDSLFDKVAHLVFVAHVRQNESGFSAEATKLGFDCLAFGLAAAGRNNRCAFFGKGKCRGTTDAGQSTGNEDNRSAHSGRPLNLVVDLKRIRSRGFRARSKLQRPDMVSWRCVRRRR